MGAAPNTPGELRRLVGVRGARACPLCMPTFSFQQSAVSGFTYFSRAIETMDEIIACQQRGNCIRSHCALMCQSHWNKFPFSKQVLQQNRLDMEL